MRILLAEDDEPLAEFIRKGLEADSYAVDVVGDGEAAEARILSEKYDLAVLDLNLPRRDGLEVLQTLRGRHPGLPVIVLTARNGVRDRIRGLDLGADDYISKPFSFSELAARIRALMRRGRRARENVIRIADLELDRVERSVKRGSKRIDLTPKEYALLEYLAVNGGRRLTRAMIIEHVWNLEFDSDTKVVDVYINYLRGKIDKGFEPKLIQTIRGVGYQLG
ncbi:MAG TPA: response regulator transcription factor [Terriglobales bacterium]|nr:response regulator transcription factor [Terriglobales bacterium]